MEDLEIKGESGVFYIPTVHLNASTGECEISGESYLEDTDEFYNTIIKYIIFWSKCTPVFNIELIAWLYLYFIA